MVYTTPEGPQAGEAFFGLKRRCCCGCTASRTKDRVRPRTTRRSARAFWREGGAPFGNPTGGGALTLRAADWVLRFLILPSLHMRLCVWTNMGHCWLLEYMVFSYLWIYFLGGGRGSFFFCMVYTNWLRLCEEFWGLPFPAGWGLDKIGMETVDGAL